MEIVVFCDDCGQKNIIAPQVLADQENRVPCKFCGTMLFIDGTDYQPDLNPEPEENGDLIDEKDLEHVEKADTPDEHEDPV